MNVKKHDKCPLRMITMVVCLFMFSSPFAESQVAMDMQRLFHIGGDKHYMTEQDTLQWL